MQTHNIWFVDRKWKSMIILREEQCEHREDWRARYSGTCCVHSRLYKRHKLVVTHTHWVHKMYWNSIIWKNKTRIETEIQRPIRIFTMEIPSEFSSTEFYSHESTNLSHSWMKNQSWRLVFLKWNSFILFHVYQ